MNAKDGGREEVGGRDVFFFRPQDAQLVERPADSLAPQGLERLGLAVVQLRHVGERSRLVGEERSGDDFRQASIGIRSVGFDHGRGLRVILLGRQGGQLEPRAKDLRMGLEPRLFPADDFRVNAAIQPARRENFFGHAVVVFIHPLRLSVVDGQEVIAEPRPHRHNPLLGLECHDPHVVRPCLSVFLFVGGALGVRRLWLHSRVGGRLRAALEHTIETVVIDRGNRLELVIVAPGTAHRQSEQAPRDHVDPVVDRVVVNLLVWPAADGEKAKRGQVAVVVGPYAREVGRELRRDKTVERQVFVERADDPIAIRVGVGILAVDGAAKRGPLTVGIAGHVEPVAAPPLAVPRAFQQAIDRRLKHRRRRVGREGVDLGDRRGQAREVERSPSQQRAAIGTGRHRPALGLERRLNEGVDRSANQVGGLHRRRLRTFDRLERPVVAGPFEQPLERRRGSATRSRVGGPHFDPFDEVGDLALRERVVGRHRLHPLLAADGMDQPALLGLAGHDDRPRGAAALERRRGVELQAAVGILGMTVDAPIDEEWTDFLFEEVDLLWRDRGRSRRLLRMRKTGRAAGHERSHDQQDTQIAGDVHRFIPRRGQANHDSITLPCTSVSRKSRPEWRNVSFS